MTKVAFKNLLIYMKQLIIDTKWLILKETLLEYIAWLCYSYVYFKKDYIEYINQLNQCMIYLNDNKYDLLYNYIEDNIIYWDLSCNEEDY